MRRLFHTLIRFAPLLGMTAAVYAAEPAPDRIASFLLIDDQLSARSIWLDDIDDRRIAFRQDGVRRSLSRDRALALLRRQDLTPDNGEPVLELVDGQRWVGRLQPAASAGDEVLWANDSLGTITVNLDRVRRMRLVRDEPFPVTDASTIGDVIRLINGDTMTGFLVELGDPVVFETDDGPVEIALDRLASMTLLNPGEPAVGLRVWTEEGSVVESEAVRLNDYSLAITLKDQEKPSLAGLEFLRAVIFETETLVGLDDLEVEEVSAPGDYTVIMPPRAIDPHAPRGLTDLELHGPIAVRWRLPAGATRFATTARLPLDAIGWADYEVVVEAGGVELDRRRINAAQPTIDILTDLPRGAGSLTLHLTEGERGPIQDVAIFTRPRVLVEPMR
ncbi:MAG: hypothetical protein ACF8PN_05760 [Phycisphaerales bacterium]